MRAALGLINAHGWSVGIPFPRPRLTLDSYFSNGACLASGTVTVRGNEIQHSTTCPRSYTSNTTVYGNSVHDNTTRLEGYGTFGGGDWLGRPAHGPCDATPRL